MNHSKSDSGHLYAIRFSSGVTKVGQTQTPDKRIATHIFNAQLHGVTAERVWISGALPQADAREHALVAFCKSRWPRVAGLEYFKCTDFAAIVSYAAGNGIPTQELRESQPQAPLSARAEGIAARLKLVTGNQVRRLGSRLVVDLPIDLSNLAHRSILAVLADADAYGHHRDTSGGAIVWAEFNEEVTT